MRKLAWFGFGFALAVFFSHDLLPLPAEDTTGTLAVAFLEKGYHAPAVLDFISLARQMSGDWLRAE